jgi:hypothetical protein
MGNQVILITTIVRIRGLQESKNIIVGVNDRLKYTSNARAKWTSSRRHDGYYTMDIRVDLPLQANPQTKRGLENKEFAVEIICTKTDA